jgi:hypothetical protein
LTVKYKFFKKAIKIFSNSNALSSDFKRWFLIRLLQEYDLYENLNGEYKLLDEEIIKKKDNPLMNDEFKRLYDDEAIRDMSFEDFIGAYTLNFSDIYLYGKHETERKNLIAIVDLNPDGDLDSIWIDAFENAVLFADLVDLYNATKMP